MKFLFFRISTMSNTLAASCAMARVCIRIETKKKKHFFRHFSLLFLSRPNIRSKSRNDDDQHWPPMNGFFYFHLFFFLLFLFICATVFCVSIHICDIVVYDLRMADDEAKWNCWNRIKAHRDNKQIINSIRFVGQITSFSFKTKQKSSKCSNKSYVFVCGSFELKVKILKLNEFVSVKSVNKTTLFSFDRSFSLHWLSLVSLLHQRQNHQFLFHRRWLTRHTQHTRRIQHTRRSVIQVYIHHHTRTVTHLD